MAMKKAEMEAHRNEYDRWMRSTRDAENNGLYRTAVKAAIAAWPYIDGMMQFERRYGEKEFASIPAIEVVLRNSPLLFDFPSLDALGALLKDYKRIERDTSHDMGAKLTQARQCMRENHRLWCYLEEHPDIYQADLARLLGGEQEYWRTVAEGWERMGLLRRLPESRSYRLTLLTRMDALVWAKCPSCGEKAEAPKAMFLDHMTCPACSHSVGFVFLPS